MKDSGFLSKGLLYANCLRSIYDTALKQIDPAVQSSDAGRVYELGNFIFRSGHVQQTSGK